MDNPFVTCPFNPQHRMLKLRLQHHIVRCRKNYMTAGMKPCPYNATHIIAQDQYREHIQTCPDSIFIEGHKYNDLHEVHGKLNEGAFHFNFNCTQEEDWEKSENDSACETSSQSTENDGIKDDNQYHDLLAEYDEDEVPLQSYLYERKKSTRSSDITFESRDDRDFNNSIKGEKERLTQQFGAGRGRILSILASLQK